MRCKEKGGRRGIEQKSMQQDIPCRTRVGRNNTVETNGANVVPSRHEKGGRTCLREEVRREVKNLNPYGRFFVRSIPLQKR